MKSFTFLPVAAALVSLAFAAPGGGGGGNGGGTTTPTAPTTNPDGTTSTTSEATGPRRFWQATLPGGTYMVAIDHICSISQQTYMLDGAVVVHEVDVDTTGQALARFYYIEPPASPTTVGDVALERAKQLVKEASARSGTDASTMVTKKYPETTHAKTIEYRMADQAELDAVYKSLKDTWISGIGRQFTVASGG